MIAHTHYWRTQQHTPPVMQYTTIPTISSLHNTERRSQCSPLVPCACKLIIQFSPSSWYERIVPPEMDGGCFVRNVGAVSSPFTSSTVSSAPLPDCRRFDGLPPAAAAPSDLPPSSSSSSSSSESLRVTPKCVAKMSDWRRIYLILRRICYKGTRWEKYGVTVRSCYCCTTLGDTRHHELGHRFQAVGYRSRR